MSPVARYSRLSHFQQLYLFIISLLLVGGGSFFIAFQAQGVATTLSQTINAGTLSVDIVDASDVSVGSPSVAFGAMTYSFDPATTTGTLGAAAQKIQYHGSFACHGYSHASPMFTTPGAAKARITANVHEVSTAHFPSPLPTPEQPAREQTMAPTRQST